ncbi:MAG TPA: hypothetical protein VF815_32700 [Myxococcaceae bacterium]|jgi:hypothetical protein
MAETKKHKAAKRAAGGRKTAAKRNTGRITLRRDTAEYRAAAADQSARIRDEIDAALADGRRTREEIEARIESQWHNRPPSAPRAESRGGRGKA